MRVGRKATGPVQWASRVAKETQDSMAMTGLSVITRRPGFLVLRKPGKERSHGKREKRGSHNRGGMQIPEDFETYLPQAGPHQSDQGEKDWKGLEGFDVRDPELHDTERGIGFLLSGYPGWNEIRHDQRSITLPASLWQSVSWTSSLPEPRHLPAKDTDRWCDQREPELMEQTPRLPSTGQR